MGAPPGHGTSGNQFLYYRRTADDRILFGGYDAIYHYGNAMGASLDSGRQSFERLSTRSPRPSRRSRTSASPTPGPEPSTPARGSAPSSTGRSTAGWPPRPATPVSGGGVALRRPGGPRPGVGARDRAYPPRLRAVEAHPVPPLALRSVGINLTRGQLARADAHQGRRNPWLRPRPGGTRLRLLNRPAGTGPSSAFVAVARHQLSGDPEPFPELDHGHPLGEGEADHRARTDPSRRVGAVQRLGESGDDTGGASPRTGSWSWCNPRPTAAERSPAPPASDGTPRRAVRVGRSPRSCPPPPPAVLRLSHPRLRPPSSDRRVPV